MSTSKKCPSAPLELGASLLGIRAIDGEVKYLQKILPLSQTLVDYARSKGKSEAKMRFTTTCRKEHCKQWKENQCGVINTALKTKLPPSIDADKKPPFCPLRPKCQWFHQSGKNACNVCKFIATDQAAALDAGEAYNSAG